MIKFTAVALMLLVLGIGTFIAMFFLESTGTASDDETTLTLSGPKDVETDGGGSSLPADMEFSVSDVPEDGLPSEKSFSDDLHHMTHQKVKADRKWGHLEITDERISEMLEIAQESSYEYKDFYIDTLEAWQNGNFENTVRVHNTIWNANNGTVGKAYDRMNEREEFEYIEKNLR